MNAKDIQAEIEKHVKTLQQTLTSIETTYQRYTLSAFETIQQQKNKSIQNAKFQFSSKIHKLLHNVQNPLRSGKNQRCFFFFL